MSLTLAGITSIDIYLQPIISINKKKIFGYEALVRAHEEDSYVSPETLFTKAKEQNLCIQLDKFLRILAIKKFHKYFLENNKALLFLNFESSAINEGIYNQEYSFEQTLQELEIPPKNIVLEIKEDNIEDTEALSQFTEYHKKQGFIIAIDDFGTGSSQYERLAIVKPDIVKIDRFLLSDIANNYIHAEIVKSIANMCHKIGATVLAEGVEQESEILKCLNFDIQIYQGYWFSKPQKQIQNRLEILEKIETIRSKHTEHLKSLMHSNKTLFLEATYIANEIIKRLCTKTLLENPLIQELLHDEKTIEALYIIDYKTAKQVGDTLFLSQAKGFYEPSQSGEDHSIKEYFYICKNSKDGEYISKKYISSASGNLCKTYSKRISLNKIEYILCLDIYSYKSK
jgi:EAL domain-containing protein (putative c-di-GMP-specific phosphodiesterase class I)